MKQQELAFSAETTAGGGEPENFKIAVVMREDLEASKRLNVTAFTISGVAGRPGVVGASYRDASGRGGLPMFKEPLLVFRASSQELARTADRARSRDVEFSIFTEELFQTLNDDDNRAAVAAVPTTELEHVGMAFRCERKAADKLLKGLKLLR